MNKGHKYIGLNQRIPFDVLNSAIENYLVNMVIDKRYVLEHMQGFTGGSNRANKASNYVVQIISRQRKLLDQFKSTSNLSFSSFGLDDRKAFCLCLICLTYPIAYDLLIALSQGLKAQSQVSKKFISEKVMSVYGSNRTVDIAIDALIPMIIEFNTIKREKVSIYSISSGLTVRDRFIQELIIYTDVRLSGSKSVLVEQIATKPWYYFFRLPAIEAHQYSHLLVKKESAVGQGYLIANIPTD
jgi:hypothetical protein